MDIKVTTNSETQAFNDVSRVVFHTNDGDVEYIGENMLNHTDDSSSVTVYHQQGVTELEGEPVVTEVKI